MDTLRACERELFALTGTGVNRLPVSRPQYSEIRLFSEFLCWGRKSVFNDVKSLRKLANSGIRMRRDSYCYCNETSNQSP
jgi:hypothetical protein